MNRLSKTLAKVALAATLAPFAAQAMETEQYEKLTPKDQINYVASLVNGTKKLLIAEGRTADADKVLAVFSDKRAAEFYENLTKAEILNKTRPADHKLHVEHAFILTLKQNGIADIPQEVMSLNKDFKPGL